LLPLLTSDMFIAVKTMMFGTGNDIQLEMLAAVPAGAAGLRPALLFVHGLGHDAACWRNWMRAASADGHAAYAISLRGHGGSGGSLRSARLTDYVEDVLRAVEVVDADELVLVGHSLGGLVVQRVLALQPAKVSAGVLVGSINFRSGLRDGHFGAEKPSLAGDAVSGGSKPSAAAGHAVRAVGH
jgi:pimeloyl-ACP methyl ester carboxylesterase